MKHFSQAVNSTNVYFLDADKFLESLARALHGLVVAMGCTPRCIEPSEEGVIADFTRWADTVKESGLRPWTPVIPAYTYTNLNTGACIVVLACDSEGKIRI